MFKADKIWNALIYSVIAITAIGGFYTLAPFAVSQPFNPGIPYIGTPNPPANNDCAKYSVSGGALGGLATAGGPCLVNTPAALTKTNDTNVTLTLGGTPATALLQAVSLTLGWTGQLAPSRIGTTAGNHGALVDVAGVSTWVTIPDCTDMAGQHLNYTQSTDLFSCGAGTGNAITALTGDVTATGPGSVAATLVSVIVAGGPIGSATAVPIITYDTKGRLTNVSNATITPPFSAVTGRATAAQIPQGGSNTVWSNWTGGTADMLANTWPSCANDGGHALVYVNGSGLVCAVIASGGTVTSITITSGAGMGTFTGTCTGTSVISCVIVGSAAQLPGSASNTAASAGNLGQLLSGTGSASPVSAGLADLAFIDVPAGDWNCWASLQTNTAGSITGGQAWLSTVSVTDPGFPGASTGVTGGAYYSANVNAGTNVRTGIGITQVIVNSSTRLYMSVDLGYTVSNTSTGYMWCRRAR
jgi:hypothetical protein